MIKFRYPLLLIFCVASIHFAATQSPTIETFEIGVHKPLSLSLNSTVYYKFRLDTISPEFDLAIIAHPEGDATTRLYLSSQEQYPNNKNNSEYYSTSDGYASIYISGSEIKLNTDYYLGVTCESDLCNLNLTIDDAKKFFMRPSLEYVIIEYAIGHPLVAQVWIPEMPNATHILFAAEVDNLVDVDQSVHMYINVGSEIPTSSKSDIMALTAWKDGKAATVYKGDLAFCTGCNYTVTIEAPKTSRVIFRRTVYGDNLSIDLGDTRNDAIEVNQTVTYAVNISDFQIETAFVLVEVTPYYGQSKIFANLGTLPQNLSDYQYKMKSIEQQELQIPVQTKPENNLLYITVYGITSSTFTIHVYSMDKTKMLIKVGEPETGYLIDDELGNYLTSAIGRKDMKLTFSLHANKGEFDLFVKSCDDKSNCFFTVNETQKVLNGELETSKKLPILQFSNVSDTDQTIIVEIDGSACSSNDNKRASECYFAIGVLSLQNGTSKFRLTVTEDKTHQVLKEYQPARAQLMLYQYKYFSFFVGNDSGINSVNFQVTRITGDVELFISRTTKYPDSKDRENPHHYNDLYSFERSSFADLSGTYYIAVKADTSATFSIVPLVKYNLSSDEAGSYTLIKLDEGVAQKTILDNQDAAFFKFDTYLNESGIEGIQITLNEVHGHFTICVRTDAELPQPNNCEFESNVSTLVISKDDPHFNNLNTLFVGVFPREIKSSNDDDNSTASKTKPRTQSFSITWSVLHDFKMLSFGTPYLDWINSTKNVYYKFEVHPNEDNEISIHIESVFLLASNIDLYLANSETKLGHNSSAFEYDRSTNGSNVLKLSKSDIKTLCDESQDGGNKYYLYLAAVSNTTDRFLYALTLTKDYDDLMIPESVEASYPFPFDNHPVHLYYYPHHLEDVTILTHSIGRNITLYANVINTREYSSRHDWEFPTNKTYDFVAHNSASNPTESRINIPASSLSVCYDDENTEKFRCGVALTLYYSAPFSSNSGLFLATTSFAKYTDFTKFSILANQEIIPIALGKPIHASVNEGAYRYFNVYVNEQQATLLISANVLSGKHVVILASKGKDARPTLADAEFKSYYGKMEALQISGSDTIQGTSSGYWTIGIYGFGDTDFVLNVISEKSRMIELRTGLPVNVDVQDEPVYFEFTHYDNSSFELKMTKERGEGIVSIKYYKEGRPLSNNLPTKENGDIIKEFNTTQSLIKIYNDSSAFCGECMYVIGIFSESPMKISLVAQIPETFILLQDNMVFTDYVTDKTSNKYEYFSFTGIVDINMVVYSGEPHIYISHDSGVNETNYIWSYTEASPNNYIRMKLNNSDTTVSRFYGGIYYILVKTSTSSNYSIAVSVSNSTRYLIDGYIDFGFLNSKEFNIYKYLMPINDLTSTKNRLKIQFTVYKDDYFAKQIVDPKNLKIIVMAVPRDFTTPQINEDTIISDFTVLEPLHHDQFYDFWEDSSRIQNLQYIIDPNQDVYIVVNNTEQEINLNYSLICNSHEPIALAFNNMYPSRLAVGQTDIYTVNMVHPGLLVIEMHECMGKVQIRASNSPSLPKQSNIEGIVDLNNPQEGSNMPKLDDESFTGQGFANTEPKLNIVSNSDDISLATIEVQEQQTIYIFLTAMDGENDNDGFVEEDAIYKIRVTHHKAKTFLPFMNLQPGGDGMIDWDATTSGRTKLGFEQVHNLDIIEKSLNSSDSKVNVEYHYEVFLTKNPDVGNYLARCDMQPSNGGKFKGIDHYGKIITFEQSNLTTDVKDGAHKFIEVNTDDNLTDFYATIRVTATGTTQKGFPLWDYPIIYKTAEVKKDSSSNGSKALILWLLSICAVLLVLALIGLCYYHKKLQRVKAKLNYEMQDVRNSGLAIQSFDTLDDEEFGRKKGGYAGLIEERL